MLLCFKNRDGIAPTYNNLTFYVIYTTVVKGTHEITTSGVIREAPGLWVCPYCEELPTFLRPAGWAFQSADNTAPNFLFTKGHFNLCSMKNIHNVNMHKLAVLTSISRQAKQAPLRNINGSEVDKRCAREVIQAYHKMSCSSYYSPSLNMSPYQKNES